MLVRFFCLGPTNSVFAIPCAQITDSYYVAHSEDLLYRVGYEQFRRMGDKGDFFRFLHSAGQLTPTTSAPRWTRSASTSTTPRTSSTASTRSTPATPWGSRSSPCAWPSARPTARAGWPSTCSSWASTGPSGRVTYFTGAFPSACGKTSTAMLPGRDHRRRRPGLLPRDRRRGPDGQRRGGHLRHHLRRQRQGRPGDLPGAHRPGRGHLLQRAGQGRQALLVRHGRGLPQGRRQRRRAVARGQDRPVRQRDPPRQQGQRPLHHLPAGAGQPRQGAGQPPGRAGGRDHLRRARQRHLGAGPAELRLGPRHHRLRGVAGERDHRRHAGRHRRAHASI